MSRPWSRRRTHPEDLRADNAPGDQTASVKASSHAGRALAGPLANSQRKHDAFATKARPSIVLGRRINLLMSYRNRTWLGSPSRWGESLNWPDEEGARIASMRAVPLTEMPARFLLTGICKLRWLDLLPVHLFKLVLKRTQSITHRNCSEKCAQDFSAGLILLFKFYVRSFQYLFIKLIDFF